VSIISPSNFLSPPPLPEFEEPGVRTAARALAYGMSSEFGKGRVESVGEQTAAAPSPVDVLEQSVIGDDPATPLKTGIDGFLAQMLEMYKGLLSGAASFTGSIGSMPPVAVGDVVLFPLHAAHRLPDEEKFCLVDGSYIVGVVRAEDFAE